MIGRLKRLFVLFIQIIFRLRSMVVYFNGDISEKVDDYSK